MRQRHSRDWATLAQGRGQWVGCLAWQKKTATTLPPVLPPPLSVPPRPPPLPPVPPPLSGAFGICPLAPPFFPPCHTSRKRPEGRTRGARRGQGGWYSAGGGYWNSFGEPSSPHDSGHREWGRACLEALEAGTTLWFQKLSPGSSVLRRISGAYPGWTMATLPHTGRHGALVCMSQVGASWDDIQRAVVFNDKKRFQISQDGIKFRATQGHCIRGRAASCPHRTSRYLQGLHEGYPLRGPAGRRPAWSKCQETYPLYS